MDLHLDAAAQALFDSACASLEASADDVAVMEQTLDVICMLLRREEDQPLRDRALAALSACLSELEGRGELSDGWRTEALRHSARKAIRLVIAERSLTAASQAAGCPTPGRRATDQPSP